MALYADKMTDAGFHQHSDGNGVDWQRDMDMPGSVEDTLGVEGHVSGDFRRKPNSVKGGQIRRDINTDEAPTYARVFLQLKLERKCPPGVEHRQMKYWNNRTESDHGKLKRIINSALCFKLMKTAYVILKGIEVKRASRKGPAEVFY